MNSVLPARVFCLVLLLVSSIMYGSQLEQQAPEVVNILAFFNNAALKTEVTSSLQSQSPEILHGLNSSAQSALQSSSNYHHHSVRTFTNQLLGCVQPELDNNHAQACEALHQAHQAQLEEIKQCEDRETQIMIQSTGLVAGVMGGFIFFLSIYFATGKCNV